MQEGLIDVWQTLERGITPAAALIEGRMKDYVKWLGRHTSIPYEVALPLDTFQNLSTDPVPLSGHDPLV